MGNDRYLNHGPAHQNHSYKQLVLRLIAVCLVLALLFSATAGVINALS